MITKIYFHDALPQATGASRKFAGRGLHAVDGFHIEELNEPGVYAVRISHPKHGTYEVRHVRYDVRHDDKPRPFLPDQLVRMGLPTELANSELDEIHESALPTVKNFCSHLGKFLGKGYGFVLTGAPGVGKSSGAAVLLKEAWHVTGGSVLMVPVYDLREMIRNKVNFDAQTTILERCKDVRFLVLDSLREEDAKDPFFDAAALAGLIEHRSQRNRSTIVTTRMTPKALVEFFPYAMSILRAKSPLLRVEGEDRRQKQSDVLKSTLIKR